MEATEGSSSAHERSSSGERVDTPISVCDPPSDVDETRRSADKGLAVAVPPEPREGFQGDFPFDLGGPLMQLGPLLTRWIRRCSLNASKGEVFDSSMAEVFPLPMPAVDESACEHAWAEAAVRALNWLAVGVLSLGEGPCTVAQESLLRELVGSI